MAFISVDTFNRHDMTHVLKFMGYVIKKTGPDTYAELDRSPSGIEKKIFKIFTGGDNIQRCYPYLDNEAYTNIRLLNRFWDINNSIYTVFELIEKNADQLQFNIPKKLQFSDLQEYKFKDLGNILLGLGFFLRKDKSTLRFPVYQGEYPEGGKRILVVKQNKDGEFIAFDNTHGGKLLDCTAIVREYNPTLGVFHIKQELDKLIAQENKGGVPSTEPLSYCYLKKGYVARYMVLRGFDRDFLINNKSLSGLLKTEILFKNGKEYANQAYIIRDVETGEKQGYIRRNFSLYNRNLKGFSGAKNGLFYSRFKPDIKSTILYSESFENSFSYYQMNLHKLGTNQVIIAATGGNPSNTQKDQFWHLVDKVQLSNLYLLGDNDIGGQKFNFYAIQKLVGEDILNKIEANEKGQKISLYSYDLSLHEKLGKKLDSICEQVEDSNLKKMVKITIPYDWEQFKKLNDVLISKFLDKERIIIKTADENDFNYDLMKKSGMLEYLEQAKKFGLGDDDLLSDKKTKYMRIPEQARKNIDKLAQDIKDGRLTAINAIELIKEEGKNIPGTISSNLKKVYKGKAITKEQIFTLVDKVKEHAGGYNR
jgi:hypothetical protein